MSEVRVFELAKELKMPAKQLLSKMRKAGIPVTGNFSEISVEQAEIVRKMAKSNSGIVVPEAVKRTTVRQNKPYENNKEETENLKNREKTKSSKIVTISNKYKSDEEQDDESPKRRVRRKKIDSPQIIKEADSELEMIRHLESDKIDTKSHGEIISENPLSEKEDLIKESKDLEIQKESLSPSKFKKTVNKNIIEFPKESAFHSDQRDSSSDTTPSEIVKMIFNTATHSN